MKQLFVVAVLAALGVSPSFAQDASPQAADTQTASTQEAPNNPDNVLKGSFPVKLEKALDSRKVKAGDTVVCRTVTPIRARTGWMIPSGSKVIGHATEAQARSKGHAESRLAIQFDKIEYAKDESIPMKGTVQAVAPSLGGPALDTSAGPPQLAVSTAGKGNSNGSSAPPISSVQIAGPHTGTPVLHANNQGVLGVKDLQLDTNGVLTSPSKDVKLEAGMQIMIHAEIQTPSR